MQPRISTEIRLRKPILISLLAKVNSCVSGFTLPAPDLILKKVLHSHGYTRPMYEGMSAGLGETLVRPHYPTTCQMGLPVSISRPLRF